jgi:RimJ/RimL family protein N-acetyltransferase
MKRMLLELPAELETDRLILRPYRAGDGPAYFDACQRNRDHLLPYESANPAVHVRTVEDAEVLVRYFAADWSKREAFFFGAWDKTTGEWIAQVYVGPLDWALPEFEIGFIVDVDHEGQGYMTESVRAVLDCLFNRADAHRVRLNCNETNVRSWRVAERCGFVREGHLRQTRKQVRLPDGAYSGDYIYGMLRTDYERATAAAAQNGASA